MFSEWTGAKRWAAWSTNIQVFKYCRGLNRCITRYVLEVWYMSDTWGVSKWLKHIEESVCVSDGRLIADIWGEQEAAGEQSPLWAGHRGGLFCFCGRAVTNHLSLYGLENWNYNLQTDRQTDRHSTRTRAHTRTNTQRNYPPFGDRDRQREWDHQICDSPPRYLFVFLSGQTQREGYI